VLEKIDQWSEALQRPVDASSLAVFRVLFGLLMLFQVSKYWTHEALFFSEPRFHFTYFSFIRPWTDSSVYVHLAAIAVFAFCLALGLFFRLSAFLFLLSYSYFFLMEKVIYNNHYYLIILLSFLLLISGAHRWGSLDALRRPSLRTGTVPFWNIFLFRAQVFVAYFFGGIAKLDHDWLRGEPVRHWLMGKTQMAVIGPYLATPWAPYFFAYGGLLFDLSIGFLLSFRRTRLPACIGILLFNITNDQLFYIGVFPYLMLIATFLFFEPDWPKRFIARLRGKGVPAPDRVSVPVQVTHPARTRLVFAFVAGYLFIQVLVPLRHWLYGPDVTWTEEGHRFSWLMMLRHKTAKIRMTVTDPATGRADEVDLQEDLVSEQIWKMAGRPDMIFQYAQFLKKKFQGRGIQDPVIRAEVAASLNYRPPQPLIDPDVNLAKAEYPLFRRASWILPGPDD
jgi:uncharacterized membrane protein YphA (DoxX/SURF4 family)